MHFFLKCMCFTRKGMCSSAMTNVLTAPHYITWLLSAQHYTAISTWPSALHPPQDTHQSLSPRCGHHVPGLAVRSHTNGRRQKCSHLVGQYVSQMNRKQVVCLFVFLFLLLYTWRKKTVELNPEEVFLFLIGKFLSIASIRQCLN